MSDWKLISEYAPGAPAEDAVLLWDEDTDDIYTGYFSPQEQRWIATAGDWVGYKFDGERVYLQPSHFMQPEPPNAA